jgi:hypothetical protein
MCKKKDIRWISLAWTRCLLGMLQANIVEMIVHFVVRLLLQPFQGAYTSEVGIRPQSRTL